LEDAADLAAKAIAARIEALRAPIADHRRAGPLRKIDVPLQW